MKKIYASILLVLFAIVSLQGQDIIAPSIKSKTSFAIVVDARSFEEAKNEIMAYKKVIENDGLGTYVLAHSWETPDQIRELLIKLYNEKKSPIEGAVFVGDIPIPMLRDAQHLTSAFKMDQRRDWQQSSIPSDRFYDDFGLKFDFLKQDSVKSLYYYYSLRADSEQRLNSNIYSGRIKPLEKGEKDKYTQLREYLNKVVQIRTQEKNNIIDNLTMARGHGYNSESRVAWAGEQLALKEQFPQLFKAGNSVKFMDFDSYWPMKPYWLTEVQSPDLDIMLFHHHGSNDYQYINGYKSGSDVNTSKENIKVYLRSKISSAVKKGKDKEEVIKHYMDYLDVPRSWCEEAFDPELIAKDSIMNESLDILVRDIFKITPNARFVMFDACYNGSFYEDENIAGAYIFNDGKTIAVQGNTVNAIQDKWPDEYIGLLNLGLRVGQWNKYVQYLESHIIGDPTFRFAKNEEVNFDINEALTTKTGDTSFWKKALKHTNPDVQAIALRVLFDNKYKGISQLLKETYLNSSDMVVRLEALQLLSRLDNDDFIEVLSIAASDSYELTRRFAVDYIVRNGSDKLIPALAKAMLNDNTSKRIVFKVSLGMRMANLDLLKAEVEKQATEKPFYDRTVVDNTLKEIESTKKSRSESIAAIADKAGKPRNIQLEINRYRNQPASQDADMLLRIITDKEYNQDIRLTVAEALGWFKYSCRKDYIIGELNKISLSEEDSKIASEITKTINRLSSK